MTRLSPAKVHRQRIIAAKSEAKEAKTRENTTEYELMLARLTNEGMPDEVRVKLNKAIGFGYMEVDEKQVLVRSTCMAKAA